MCSETSLQADEASRISGYTFGDSGLAFAPSRRIRYGCAVATTKSDQMNAAVIGIGLLALLDRFPDSSGKEEVHRLRTSVRRLEVHLRACPPKIGKCLKRLRKKAGTVRDIDVHLDLLEDHLFARRAPEKSREKLREILKSKRERHLDTLLDLVSESNPLLVAKLPALAERASQDNPDAQQASRLVVRVREQYLRLTRRIPDDDAQLHQLRIHTKKLRYSLEPLESFEDCAELAAKLKQVQDAIGNWHDWATLHQLAERELKASQVEPVCQLLEARAKREYRKARRTAQTVRIWMTVPKPVALAVGNEPQRLLRKAG